MTHGGERRSSFNNEERAKAMKAFAMLIWEVQAGEFVFWMMVFVGVLVVVRFLAYVIKLGSVK